MCCSECRSFEFLLILNVDFLHLLLSMLVTVPLSLKYIEINYCSYSFNIVYHQRMMTNA